MMIQEVARMRRLSDSATEMAFKILIILAVVLLVCGLLGALFGCATTATTDGNPNGRRVERVISSVQRIERAINWIAPLACTAIAVAAPSSIPACRMAVASAKALQVVSDQAIAAYRQDPNAQNAEAITDVLGKMKDAWNNLDAAYKGDAGKLESVVQHESRLPPNVMRRGSGGFGRQTRMWRC